MVVTRVLAGHRNGRRPRVANGHDAGCRDALKLTGTGLKEGRAARASAGLRGGPLRLALVGVAHDPAVAEDESAVAARGDTRIVGGDEQREATFSSQSVEYDDNLGAGLAI